MKLAAVVLLTVVLVAIAGVSGTSFASPSGPPILGPSTVFVGDSTGLTASWGPDEQGPAVLSATADIGDFISASATGGNDFGTVSGLGTSSLTINDDVDAIVEATTTVNAVFKCTSAGTTNFTISHQGSLSLLSDTLTCVEPSSGGNGGGGPEVGVIDAYQVVVTASPNILPCEGGTTVLTAEAVDAAGNELADAEFRFFTDAGTLVQTSSDTAKLTLGPNQTLAKVTATIPDATDKKIESAVTYVGLECNGDATNQTLVVTANPNVIDCTGTTTITASVRDVNGHVVTGRGYHFATSAGLLEVDPNNASTEEGVATLTLRPGDGDATVTVTSGLLYGTYEDVDAVENNFVVDETEMVTVQQNCLGTTTGQIRVNSSATTVACGQNVFIGLHVIDQDIQTVVDDTPITLIATAGGFYGGVVDGNQTLQPAAQVPTSHGEANVIYTAPSNFSGEVRVTAASGDVYGSTKINVTCVATGTSTSSSSGTTAPACVDIGDGVCITPPNTGRSVITPPNTGSAGLK